MSNTRHGFSMISHRGAALLLGVSLLVMPALCTQAGTYGAKSPQALLERLQKAGENNDFAELAACIAPNDRAQMTLMMVVMTGFMVGMNQMGNDMAEGVSEAFGEEMSEEEQAKARAEQEAAAKKAAEIEAKFNAILAKHGVSELLEEGGPPEPQEDEDPGEAAARLLKDVDQIALITDLFTFMDEVSDSSDEPMPVPTGKPENLQIDGDRATATVADEEVEMVRIDGLWYLSMPME